MKQNKIRVLEKFKSSQGEGYWVGRASIFLRTFGCPFRCRGFGMPAGELSNEAIDLMKIVNDPINKDKYKTLADLPLVSTGCDSYAAILPEAKRFTTDLTAPELASEVISLLPKAENANKFNRWKYPSGTDIHLVITGGEPLLWQKFFPEFLSLPEMADLNFLTFETNATQLLSEDFHRFLSEWVTGEDGLWDSSTNRDLTFSCSVKLKASGEPADKAINPDVVLQYQGIGRTYLKLVTEGTPEQMDEIDQVVHSFRRHGFIGEVFLMPTGGVLEGYMQNISNVGKVALERGYSFSPREHIMIFGNAWST